MTQVPSANILRHYDWFLSKLVIVRNDRGSPIATIDRHNLSAIGVKIDRNLSLIIPNGLPSVLSRSMPEGTSGSRAAASAIVTKKSTTVWG
jgi:hypothetical protein